MRSRKMDKWVKFLAFLLIASIVICGLILYINEDLFLILVREDGLFENITAFTLLLISVFLLVRLIRQGRSRNKKWLMYNAFLIIGLFLGFAEEISWGQRIFSTEPNDFFLQNNIQEETNLHNLQVKGVSINRLIFSTILPLILAIYFSLSLFLYKRNNFFRKLVDNYGVQIPRIKYSLLLLLISLQIIILPSSEKWELWECLFPLIFLLVFIDPYNKEEKLFRENE